MSSPDYWSHLVQYRWSLIADSWRAAYALPEPIPQINGRDARGHYQQCINYDAVNLVQGARNVIRYRDTYAKHTDDNSIRLADEKYSSLADITACRDAIDHFDEYSIGQGKKPFPPMDGGYVHFEGDDLLSATLTVGPYKIVLHEATKAVQELAVELEAQWYKHVRYH